MRNRRLLTLAVLAVALGCAAFAQAETAVVTLLDGGAGSFQINVSLASGTELGTTSNTPGLADYAIKNVLNADSLLADPKTISGMDTGAYPGGQIDTTAALGTPSDAGFTFLHDNGADPNWRPVGAQNFAFTTDTDHPQAERNAAVLTGVGVSDATDDGAGKIALPAGLEWTAGGDVFQRDTKIASGTYTGTEGSLDIVTWGPVSFSVLPHDGNSSTSFTGPTTDPYNTDGSFYAEAVVIQTVAGSVGNDGGRIAASNATNLRVEYGDVTLGASFVSGTDISLELSDPNVSITLGANHNVGGLDIQNGNDGAQIVDVGASRLNVFDTSQLAAIKAAVDGTGADGLYSSQVDQANEVLVVAKEGSDHIAIQATVNGDINLDGTVDPSDFSILGQNWLTSVDTWTLGDLNDDGTVDPSDFTILGQNWLTSFTPTGAGAVPEPATMSLLCLGAFGLLRRRRR